MNNYLKKSLGHFCIVCKHRWYVLQYAVIAGIIWQGLTHDLSKFSPAEFFERVKYHNCGGSPIDICKKEKGYSLSWMHHRGRNKHHYEYWTDNYDYGTTTIQMPKKYAVEMICDFLAAGKAYNNGVLDFDKELRWWEKKKETALMHPKTLIFVDLLMTMICRSESTLYLKKRVCDVVFDLINTDTYDCDYEFYITLAEGLLQKNDRNIDRR